MRHGAFEYHGEAGGETKAIALVLRSSCVAVRGSFVGWPVL